MADALWGKSKFFPKLRQTSYFVYFREQGDVQIKSSKATNVNVKAALPPRNNA